MPDYFYNPTAAPGITISLNDLITSENNFNLNIGSYLTLTHATVLPAADIVSGYISLQTDLSAYKRILIKNIFYNSNSYAAYGSLRFSDYALNRYIPAMHISFSVGFHSAAFVPTALTDNNVNLFLPEIDALTFFSGTGMPDKQTYPLKLNSNIIGTNTYLSVIISFYIRNLYSFDCAAYYLFLTNLLGYAVDTFNKFHSISIQGEIY